MPLNKSTTVILILALLPLQKILADSFIDDSALVDPLLTEFSHVPVTTGLQDYDRYLDENDIKRIDLVYRNSRDDNTTRWYEVVDHSGRVLKRFGDNYQLSRLAEGRYRDRALLLVGAQRMNCKESCNSYHLFGSDNKAPDLSGMSTGDGLDTLMLEDGALLSIGHVGLQFIQNVTGQTRAKLMPAPLDISDAALGSNIDGDWMAIAVSDQGMIMLADRSGWDVLDVNLAAHGDRSGVLAVYPKGNGRALIALYRYINEYNKGLYLLDYDKNLRKVKHQGWLFNSEDSNIGFDPEIYRDSQTSQVIVSADKSSEGGQRVYFALSASDMKGLSAVLPLHVQQSGFVREKKGALMIGAGISQISWVASSKVEDNGVSYSEVDYLLADTQFVSANLEARLGNTSFTLNYLMNQAEQLLDDEIDGSVTSSTVATLTKEASSYLLSSIDFHGLLSASSSLRLQFELGETNGVAEVSVADNEKVYSRFSTGYNRIALLAMKERGLYMGGDYVGYSMPSAVGFSDSSGAIVLAGYDPDFEFDSLRFVFGYDALAYAKRYETNYSRLYWAGGGSIGLGWATLSDRIIDEARQDTGKSRIADLPIFFVLGGELEFGYIWQQRSKGLGGLGYSAALGYKFNANYLGAGQDGDNPSDDVDSLALEFSRFDLFHGPFLKANILF